MKDLKVQLWPWCKDMGKRFLRSLYSNWPYKLISLLFAILLWAYVLGEVNPMRQRTLTLDNVYFDTTMLERRNLTTALSVEELRTDVHVTVELPRQELALLSEENITLEANLSNITSEGMANVEITARTTRGNVVTREPRFIQVEIERLVTNRPVPVNVEMVGTLNDTLWFDKDKVEFSANEVKVSGAASVVNRIAEAHVALELGHISEAGVINRSVRYEFFDENGVLVEHGNHYSFDTVNVKFSVGEKRVIPVDIENSIVGKDKLKSGYEIKEVSVTPQHIMVVGMPEALDEIKGIALQSILDLAGKDMDITHRAALNMVSGIMWMETNTADVIVRIGEVEATRKLTLPQVQLWRDGVMVSTAARQVKVTVTGPKSQVDALSAASLVAYVNITGLPPGEVEAAVDVQLPSEALKAVCDPAQVKVTVP